MKLEECEISTIVISRPSDFQAGPSDFKAGETRQIAFVTPEKHLKCNFMEYHELKSHTTQTNRELDPIVNNEHISHLESSIFYNIICIIILLITVTT
ncbi:hypothetical protein NQ315_004433, partial [Exocentrus adspersus]